MAHKQAYPHDLIFSQAKDWPKCNILCSTTPRFLKKLVLQHRIHLPNEPLDSGNEASYYEMEKARNIRLDPPLASFKYKTSEKIYHD